MNHGGTEAQRFVGFLSEVLTGAIAADQDSSATHVSVVDVSAR